MIVGWCLLVFNVGYLYLSVVPMVFLCSVANVLLICFECLLFSYLHINSHQTLLFLANSMILLTKFNEFTGQFQ